MTSPTPERGALLLDALLASFIGALLVLSVVQLAFLYQQRVREDVAAFYLDEVHQAAEAYAASEAFQATRTSFREDSSAVPVFVSVSALKAAGLVSPAFPDEGPYGAPTITYKAATQGARPFLNISVRLGEATRASAGRILNSMKTQHKGFYDGDVVLRWHHGGQADEDGIKAFLGEDATGWQGASQIITASTLPLSHLGNINQKRTLTIRINQEALHRILQDTLYYNSHRVSSEVSGKIVSDPQISALRDESDADSIADRFRIHVAEPLRPTNFDYASENPSASTTTVLRDAADANPSLNPNHRLVTMGMFTNNNGITLDSLKTGFQTHAMTKSRSDIKQYRGTTAIKPHILRSTLYHFHEDFSPGHTTPPASETRARDPFVNTQTPVNLPIDAYMFFSESDRIRNDLFYHSSTRIDLVLSGFTHYIELSGARGAGATTAASPDGAPAGYRHGAGDHFQYGTSSRYYPDIPETDYRWLEENQLDGTQELFDIKKFEIAKHYYKSFTRGEHPSGIILDSNVVPAWVGGRALPQGSTWTSPFTEEEIQQEYDRYNDHGAGTQDTDNPFIYRDPSRPAGERYAYKWKRFDHPAVYGQPIISARYDAFSLGGSRGKWFGSSMPARAYAGTYGGKIKVNPTGSGYDIPAHVCPENHIAWFSIISGENYGIYPHDRRFITNLPLNNIWFEDYMSFGSSGSELSLAARQCLYTYPPSDNALRGPAYMLTPPDTGADNYIVTIADPESVAVGDCLKIGQMHSRRTGSGATPCLAWLESDVIEDVDSAP